LADTQAAVIRTSLRKAQASDWYYGWWVVDDEEDDWYYWFTADVVMSMRPGSFMVRARQLHFEALKGRPLRQGAVTCTNHLVVARSCRMRVNAEVKESPRR